MRELVTSARMRAIESAMIASGAVTGLELMERAGRGVVAAIAEEWPGLGAGCRAVVLCGPGNNGGDGFVVARLLKERGWAVEVFLHGAPEALPPDARSNYERWCRVAEVRALGSISEVYDLVARSIFLNPDNVTPSARADVVVDALFGTGMSRAAEELNGLFELSEYYYDLDAPKWVAVDVPTGLCADSGRVFDAPLLMGAPHAAVRADLTVTFQWPKPGHYLDLGPEFCGRVVVVDIGLAATDVPLPASQDTRLVTPPGQRPPHLKKHADRHKYAHGHALILAGPPGRGGAARLCARGALRIGAGLVTVGCPPEAVAENAARLDAVMLRPVEDADALGRILEDGRINALCLGPGLGLDARAAGLVAAALGAGESRAAPALRAGADAPATGAGTDAARRPVVLDADALTLIARAPALFAALHEGCILTPHGGEFARLFPDIAERLDTPARDGPAYSKVDATREAAVRAGCTVLFKGPDTVIADPSGRALLHAAAYDRAAPWLATAGAGDVLAGFIAGLLARGQSPMQAAETAVWLHVECARAFGPGLIAEDLPDTLPAVLRGLDA